MEMVNGSSGHGEKIFVSVRMRPLNGKEILRKDVSDWECINDDTIIFKNNLSVPDRSVYPTAYTFDRVFGCNCSTREVYEDGVKEVAFSVVSGINSSIFAYGQTSSGKTYTMTRITEYTMADIYKYIENHDERKFFLRFSAMEIYNESVRDLLSSDSTPLRLLDDPEKGTTVEKLTEETLKDWNHLKELLSHCEGQRVVGETSLNETSSRSHQILRLTIESSARDFLGLDHPSTLTATVNFIDLAGSERASQSLSAGSKLKEGCHINRSLLTLGTVIRKLSKGRFGHVPFRDSKLTRILHSSLDGNARTAIICTMCPARSHVEQSRNTLLFGSCAKEVTTNAQVNVVVSDKALVKHLQRELARLENELRISGTHSVTSDSAALLREKDLQIEELKKQMTKLILQRDLAQSQESSVNQYSKLRVQTSWDEQTPTFDVVVLSESHSVGSFEVSQASERHSRSNSEAHYLQFPDRDNNLNESVLSPSMVSSSVCGGTAPCKKWEEIDEPADGIFDNLCKEVRCLEIEGSSTNRTVESTILFRDENPDHYARNVVGIEHGAIKDLVSFPLQEDIELSSNHPIYDFPSPNEPPSHLMAGDSSSSRCLKLSNSRSCKESLVSTLSSRWFEETENYKNTPPIRFEKDFEGRPEGPQTKVLSMNYCPDNEKSSKNDPHTTLDILKAQNIVTSSDEDGISISTIKKRIAKLQSDKKFIDTRVQETESEGKHLVKNVQDVGSSPLQHDYESSLNWPLKFKTLQKEIIELWDACNISLVHRTYFFLLIKGDLTDAIYMEVELRRLSFLKETFSRGNQIVENGGSFTLASSTKALRREREMLCKKMLKRLSEQERESLYRSWGIELRSKNRRSQLAYRLWNDTNDMNHITESANIVAKLVSFIKPEEQAYKEMFELNFTPKRRSFSWKRMLMSIF